MSTCSKELISIIIPIYNAELYLGKCLDSLVNQIYSNFEVLCIDDGSTDNSCQIINNYTVIDSRFILISQSNGGVSKARNTALNLVKGKFVCFVDADDIVSPLYLQTLLKLASEGCMPICYYSRDIQYLNSYTDNLIYYDSKFYINQVFNEKVFHPMIWGMLFDADIIRGENLRFTIGCVRNEDTEFYIKYMVLIHKVVVTNSILYYYRINPLSATRQWGINAMSYIDANERISHILIEAGIIEHKNLIVPASVQYLAYKAAIQGGLPLYNYLHDKYNVRQEMIKMLQFPRLSRKIVAFFYLIVGKCLFFKILSLIKHLK